MRKMILIIFTLLFTLTISVPPHIVWAESPSNPRFSTPSELIDAVNTLRSTYGLAAYNPNSILMTNAQKQAEFILSSGAMVHTDANGLRPYQRALIAGYPVAGDLSQGGWFSENIVGGSRMTADDAVNIWTGDTPHMNTMISADLHDIGAGVAVSDYTYIYVIDCGLSTGGTPAAFTPPPSYMTPISTTVLNTPNADGSVIYIVQSGDTILAIAIAYGLSESEILALNGLTEKSTIYPGQRIIVRAGYTPTYTLPTGTPTMRSTITDWPTSTLSSTKTLFTPTAPPGAELPISTARVIVLVIAGTAMGMAAMIAILGRKRK